MSEYERLEEQRKEIVRKQCDKAADKIVTAILNDLTGRKGIGDDFDCLDEDIQREIKTSWKRVVSDELVAMGMHS